MALGTIARLIAEKGFGFIKDDDSGKEYFFHRSAATAGGARFELLREGQPVSFEASEGPKGPRADRVSAA